MNQKYIAQAIIESRARLLEKTKGLPILPLRTESEEGGCGVTGFACNIPVSGRHIFEPSVQMHNRGNGKGGGIAAVGLEAEKLGVDQNTLETHFLLQVALLDPTVLKELESQFVRPFFKIAHEYFAPTVDDFRDIPGLEIEPPTGQTLFCSGPAQSPGRISEGKKFRKINPGKGG